MAHANLSGAQVADLLGILLIQLLLLSIYGGA
jgi:hypothetical protein